MKTQKPMRGVFERPPGSGCWWISYFAQGRHHREKVGPRSVAIEAYRLRKTQARLGQFFPIGNRAKAEPTFGVVAKEALASKNGRLAPLTVRCDEIRWKVLSASLGSKRLREIDARAIESALNELSARKISGSTINRYRALLSGIFSFAIRTGLCVANPVSQVQTHRESEHRIRFLDQDEEGAVRAIIRKNCPEREAELDIALHTGIRRGEQFGLKWEDVDLERGILTVRGKTGRRFVEINSHARAAFLKLHSHSATGSPHVCQEAKRDGQRDWRRWFERSLDLAGIDNFRWHDLRHTFASRLVMAGVDLATVQQLLGHRSILMTMRYAHLSPGHRRDAVEKLAAGVARRTKAKGPTPISTGATSTGTSTGPGAVLIGRAKKA